MVSVISIVNSEYADKSLNISCAKHDGEQVLNAFVQLLQEDCDVYSSGCFENIRSDELDSFLRIILNSRKGEGEAILYFSCHGVVDDTEFCLLLSDAVGNDKNRKYGYVPISDLYRLCYDYPQSNFLLIFDCCYSGQALSLANNKRAEMESNITVLSSSNYYERSRYTDSGSEFTNSLCRALRALDGQAEDITVARIVKKMEEENRQCLVNISEGKADFVIQSRAGQAATYNVRFVDTFIKRLDNCVAVREMMWYSIADFPNGIKRKIFQEYLNAAKEGPEASWLVRRAMGNALASLDGGNQKEKKIVEQFLKSPNWMNRCVGIVAVSKAITEERASYLKELIKKEDSAMDLVWLADLYLSDSPYYDLQVALNSRLAKSLWGLIEIWDRYVEKCSEEELFQAIEANGTEQKLLDGLRGELELRKHAPDGSLASVLYNGKRRGRTVDLKQKWLLSLLYGNWRGRVECDLSDYLTNNKREKIKKELEEAQSIPSVERRMSLFEYFENEQKYLKKYKTYIRWGLTDPHPWVRRIAILCFKDEKEMVQEAFQDKINTELFPETFAMIINAASITLEDYQSYIKLYKWTECEEHAISTAVFRENKRKYM